MGPILLPFVERRVRGVLQRRGVIAKKISTRAGNIHVYDAPGKGDLPTMLILHGISASGTGFAPLFMRLRQHAKRVIVPDYPGHGLSKDPSIPLTLDTLFESMTGALDDLLGDEPFIVIGNSLGGVVALDYAVKRAPKVAALVLLSPAGAASTAEQWNAIIGSFEVKTRRESLAFLEKVYHRVPLPAKLLAFELPASIRRRGVTDLFGSVSIEDQVLAEDLAKLTMPILFVWGQSERLLPDAHLDWWKANLPPQAVIERPEGMGHLPHFDAPERLARRIVSFVQDHVTMKA